MNIKSIVITAALTTAILGFGVAVKAETTDISAMIAQLQAQVQVLLQKIADLKAQQGTGTAWCHTFNANIGMGQKTGNPEIEALKIVLQKEGVYDSATSSGEGYDEAIASAITGLQEKYSSEILSPYNLRHGTGFLGKSTRAKLNALYGCNVACTMEAKQCPDGSYVGRRGPKCEFAECPEFEHQCKTDSDCPQPTCSASSTAATPTCAGTPVKCVEEKCTSATTTCSNLYWLDNTDKTCQTQKQFCGAYMYLGLQTFKEKEDCLKAVQNTIQPSIKIISPNGGEIYKIGDSITINWKTSNVDASQKLDVIRLRAYPDGQEYNLVYNALNDGQEVVSIPSSMPVGAYTLEIKSYVNNILVFDASDSYLKIVLNTTTCPIINCFTDNCPGKHLPDASGCINCSSPCPTI